jgi:hypothetical protein
MRLPLWLHSRSGQVLLVTLGIAGIYLLTQHWAHSVAALPWVLLLACPLLHVSMHGGHGGHGRADQSGSPKSGG